eukprot:UN32676
MIHLRFLIVFTVLLAILDAVTDYRAWWYLLQERSQYYDYFVAATVLILTAYFFNVIQAALWIYQKQRDNDTVGRWLTTIVNFSPVFAVVAGLNTTTILLWTSRWAKWKMFAMPLIRKKRFEIMKRSWTSFIFQNIPQIIIQSFIINETRDDEASKLYRVCFLSLIFSCANFIWAFVVLT